MKGWTFLFLVFISFMFLGNTTAQAANHYIWCGATGAANGAEWTDAYTDLPASLTRGDTYIVAGSAGCNYGPHTFRDPASGTTTITIRYAEASLDSGVSGWQASFGTAQALFTTASAAGVWIMEGPYYVFNGVTGSGYSGYGIKVWAQVDASNGGVIAAPYGSGTVTNLTFENLEVEAPSFNQTYTADYPMYFNSNVSYLMVNNCFIHQGQIWLGVLEDSTNVTIEHSHFQNAGTQSGSHATGIFVENQSTYPSNLTIAYNVLENMVGTSNTSYIELVGGTGWGGIAIYGNVIWNSYGTGEGVGQSMIGVSGSSTTSPGSYQANNVVIYNNTFYGLTSPNCGSNYYCNAGALYFGNGSINIDVENNIWQNIAFIPYLDVTTNVNNMVNTGAANFANASVGNFNLTSHTFAGTTFGSPYNMDPNGNIRGADGIWDVGAYQFVSSTPTAPTSSTPGLVNVYSYPNPAVGGQTPVIRVEMGVLSSIEITIFDVSGRTVNSATLSGASPGITPNGQYYYDYPWTGHITSGVYFAVIHGKAADGTIVRAKTKIAVVR